MTDHLTTKCGWCDVARRALLSTASAVVLLGPAFTARAAAAAAADTSANRATSVEEVTVTARKKEERLIDVPVAAQVLSAETIKRYETTDLIQLSTIAPGVLVTRTGGGTPGGAIFIRGIGIFGPDYASEQPVSLVIDGMPITRGHFIDTGFFDQSDIQVLKGPQSLFYGKNSPAGVVAINSMSPHGKLEGYLKASYGFATEDPIIEGAVSVPITSTLSVRLAVRAEDMQGGYVHNNAKPLAVNPIIDPFFGGKNQPLEGANFDRYPKTKELIERFTAVWKPTTNFDATLKVLGSYYHDNASFGSQAISHCGNGTNPIYGAVLGGVYQDLGYNCKDPTATNDSTVPGPVLAAFKGAPADGKAYTLTQVFQSTLTANYRLPYVTLTSVTGYYHLNAAEFDNYDNTIFAETPDYQDENTSVYTQELRATTSFNFPVNFTVGGFYEHERRFLSNTNRIFLLGPLPANLQNQGAYAGASNSMIGYDSNYTEDFSFFGQFNWKILPNLELAGGGRWTDTHKKATVTQLMQALDQLFGPYSIAQQYSPLTPAGQVYNAGIRSQNFSPEVTLSWHPSRNIMLYAAYKTGYLSGGIANPGVVTNYVRFTGGAYDPVKTAATAQSNLSFGAEKVKGEEIGVKGTFLDGRLSGDLTLFHYTYYGLQVTTFHSDTTTFSIGNAGSAIDQGVELNTNFAVNRNLSLRAALIYVPLRYSKYNNSPCYAGQTAATGCLTDPVTHANFQDLSHQAFGAPPLILNFGASWNSEITSTLSLNLNGDIAVYDRTPLQANNPNTSTPSHAIANATAKIYQTTGPWSVSLIGTNLNGDTTLGITNAKPLGSPQDIGGTIPPGREIRLQAEYRF